MNKKTIDEMIRTLEALKFKKSKSVVDYSPVERDKMLRDMICNYLAGLSTIEYKAFISRVTEARKTNPWRIAADEQEKNMNNKTYGCKSSPAPLEVPGAVSSGRPPETKP